MQNVEDKKVFDKFMENAKARIRDIGMGNEIIVKHRRVDDINKIVHALIALAVSVVANGIIVSHAVKAMEDYVKDLF